jgi:riboflavin kinase / FMN adenylyltransferase
MQVRRSTSLCIKTPIALTIGNFDGVHLGHQAMLIRLKKAAKQRGLRACVMTFEPHPCEFFSPEQAPARLTSLREKLELLAKSNVDQALVYRFNRDFAKTSPEVFVTRILVNALSVRWILVGDDFRFGARRAGDLALLKGCAEQYRFEVEEMPSFTINNQRVSSSAVRQALAIDDLNAARRYLGRHYSISGRVIHGNKLGKKLGFPTVNIQMRHNRSPLSGIFVVEVYDATESSQPKKIPGVASLGVRPTVCENGRVTLEVHLLDFDQDIYGRYLRVDFLHKLRNEETYPDLGLLVKQMEKDVENTRNYFLLNTR